MSILSGGSIFTQYSTFEELIYAIDIGSVPSNVAFTLDKFGENLDIDSTTEDVWVPGGTKEEQTTSGTIEILSSSTADDGDPPGTGAQTVQIEGIDDSYNLIDPATVTMDGTTPVELEGYMDVHRAIVLTAGSGLENAGTITIRKKTGPVTINAIAAGENQTQSTYYIIPANHTGYLIQYTGSLGDSSAGGNQKIATMTLERQRFGTTVWLHQQTHHYDSTSNPQPHNVHGIDTFNEKERIKFICTSESTNTLAYCNWEMVIVNNDYLPSVV